MVRAALQRKSSGNTQGSRRCATRQWDKQKRAFGKPPEVLNVNFNPESTKIFQVCCAFCCFLLVLFVCFVFKFKSEKSVRSQQELCSTGNAGSDPNARPPPSQQSQMSEQVPNSHHSLPGHFPTFSEMQYKRGLQSTFKPTHFRVTGERGRKAERSETTTHCTLILQCLMKQESNITNFKMLFLLRFAVVIAQDSCPHSHRALRLTGSGEPPDVAHPAAAGLTAPAHKAIQQGKRTASEQYITADAVA